MLSVADIEAILERTPAGFKSSENEFFKEANKNLFPAYKKLGVISFIEPTVEDTAEETSTASGTDKDILKIYCDAPDCDEIFQNVSDYQTHFRGLHSYVCAQCKRSLPSDHLLSLHLAEEHDSFFAARLERGGEAMYACYVEDCEEKLPTPALRRKHCIEKHHFPANYRFEHTTKKKRGKEVGQQVSRVDDNAMECEDSVEPTKKQNSSKVNVFTFGRQKKKTFNTKQQRSPHGAQTANPAPLENLTGLKMCLDKA